MVCVRLSVLCVCVCVLQVSILLNIQYKHKPFLFPTHISNLYLWQITWLFFIDVCSL